MAVERIIELVNHKTLYPQICMQLHFIKENCQRLMDVITSLEERKRPLACLVYNLLEDLRSYLCAGSTKENFGTNTDLCLSKFSQPEKKKHLKSFQGVYKLAESKLVLHLDQHPAYDFYKAARIFDTRQLPTLGCDIGNYGAVTALANPSTQLSEEWLIYTRWSDALPNPFNILDFWKGVSERFPALSSIAVDALWMPVTSVDVERSFSQYKHILNERRESLTEENTKRLLMLYFNGDIEGRFS